MSENGKASWALLQRKVEDYRKVYTEAMQVEAQANDLHERGYAAAKLANKLYTDSRAISTEISGLLAELMAGE